MNFSITFPDSLPNPLESPFSPGLIVLDGDQDWFHSSLSFWNKEQYEQQWEDAVKRILTGQQKSALITNLIDPEHANILTWWPMWNLQEHVYIQNHLLFLHEQPVPFDISRPYDFVGERETHFEDGTAVSEWEVTLDDLSEFLSTRR